MKIVVVVAILASSTAGQERPGKIYFVSSAGDDANDGAAVERPLATLSKASSLLRPGDTVRLKRGEVFGGPFRLEAAGTEAAPIGVDAWVVKLMDVYPDSFSDPDPNPAGVKMAGFQQLLRGE